MRRFNPIRFYRALAGRRSGAAQPTRRPSTAVLRPSIYIDAAVARALAAMERQIGILPAGGMKLLLAGPTSPARPTDGS